MSYYAVKSGRSTGIYSNWNDCKKEVSGFGGSAFKKFSTLQDAQSYMGAPSQSSGTASTGRSFSSGSSDLPPQISYPPPKKKCTNVTCGTYELIENVLPISFLHDLHDPKQVIVFTDGSCKGPQNDRRAGKGVYWGDEHPWNVASRLSGRQSNNHAELEASYEAVKKASENGITNLKVVTDSKFTIDCMKEWYPKWRENGWRLSNGQPVALKQSVEKLANVTNQPGMNVSWCYAPGHKGIKGNEEADKLANIGADLPMPNISK